VARGQKCLSEISIIRLSKDEELSPTALHAANQIAANGAIDETISVLAWVRTILWNHHDESVGDLT